MNYSLLKQLCEIHAPSGEEGRLKEFLTAYIRKASRHWKVKPKLIEGEEFQDCLLLKFGRPRTLVLAHMDSIGFTVRYQNQLLTIGSPEADMGTRLVGRDSHGEIECELEYDKENHAFYKFGRTIDHGTSLTYKSNWRETKTTIQTPYLDNRLGIYNVLRVAESMKDGIIAFTCWEEHGGGSVGYVAEYVYRKYGVRQALISDITWTSDGVEPGKGVVISLRDRNIPRRSFVNKIIAVAKKNHVSHQLEVEGMGSSDGGELQRSPFPFDWCFVGAPQLNPHTPDEKVNKSDIESMVKLYSVLMRQL